MWTSCDTLFSCIRPQLTIRNQSIVCNSILTCILCSDIHTHVGRGSEYIAFCVTNNHCVKNVILGRSGVFFHCLPNEYPSCSHTATARRGGNGGCCYGMPRVSRLVERGGVELALVRYTQGETRRATFISQERAAVKLRGVAAGNEQLLLGRCCDSNNNNKRQQHTDDF